MILWERLLVTAVIAILLFIAVWSFRRIGRWRVNRTVQGAHLSILRNSGNPTLLYFWSTNCAQCKVQETQIREAEQSLAVNGRTITVSKHDAVTEEGLSSRMGVVTVPTTVVLRGDGSIAAWNPGLTASRTLARQVLSVFGDAPSSKAELCHQEATSDS